MSRSAAWLLAIALPACQKPAPPVAHSEPVVEASISSRLRFAIIGDFGADNASEAAVANLVKSWNPGFIITTGDNNYPDGSESTIDVNIGKYFGDFIGHYSGHFGRGSADNRFWPCPGNHDWRAPGLDPYRAYFTLPGNERYYDVDLGPVHLYSLDSDAHEPDGTAADSTQAMWLKERLAASKACFDIVYFHHPPYSSGPHGGSLYMRWPFRAWGAEVVVAGHDHTYERFDIDGIPYIVNGLGGASRYEFNEQHEGTGSAYRYNQGFGAMLATVGTDGLTFEFTTADGTKRDSFVARGRCAP